MSGCVSFLLNEKMENYYNVLDLMIRNEINKGKRIAIYPFGKNGLQAKNIIVKRYGLPIIIIDNHLANYNHNIFSIDDYKKIDGSDITIIISATNYDINKSIMNNINDKKLKAQISNIIDYL